MRMPVSTAHTHSSEYFLIFLHLSWVRFEVLTFHKAAAKQISFFLISLLFHFIFSFILYIFFRSKIRENKSKSERSAHAEKKNIHIPCLVTPARMEGVAKKKKKRPSQAYPLEK